MKALTEAQLLYELTFNWNPNHSGGWQETIVRKVHQAHALHTEVHSSDTITC